ncbi:DUF3145 domain-containing protein [Brevibacterium sp. 50QC2O2]|uniref:DUF3145 domain-containing protein n=1 Tax=Brevibacterium TaxID=1696 RepID=UPI00211D0FF2|nr:MULTISPECIES: DUF3145 domain-containing protein [unclassified Brevibacterium]MCQ9369379.1 DUF3145 domain-containing protein [Brevibacterium sp. 91QC2O2]MCQ9386732.1 DUF3145 domain-containing protein [Brevibacterium sp. 68QC2CO]MCQ9389686.1 DUF3145 domain-containing protein [Brevibacterium sp. 50QC2O2]
MTEGVLFVHSAPRALCPHIEWAAGGAIGAQAKFDWSPQPAAPGTFRAEICWRGPAGSGAKIASALRGWEGVRYEVTEEPSEGQDGSRWSHTPGLGVYHALTDAFGNIVVPEDTVRNAMRRANGDFSALEEEMSKVLGAAWDDELEPFRHAGEGAPVRWLSKVG